jgi:hypothetical protein
MDGVRLLCEIEVPKRVMAELKFKAWNELVGEAHIRACNGVPGETVWTSWIKFIKVIHENP